MKCFSAIQTQNGKVPCGQCINCRINKGRAWTGRLLLEVMYAPCKPGNYNWFATFTYREESVPWNEAETNRTLDKNKFLKWVNNQQRPEKGIGNFRYFAVGEYGDKYSRPHYHMAVFNQSLQKIRDLCDNWTAGFSSYSDFNETRAAYICQYTTKKLSRSHGQRYPEGVEPEFRTSTRVPPIGSAAISGLTGTFRTDTGETIIQQDGDIPRSFRYAGKLYPLDGYILRKTREQLGIPETHTGRIDWSDTYFMKYPILEAEQCPTQAKMAQEKANGTQALKKTITRRV